MAERPFPAYQGDGTYLFVSYAHADAEIIYPEMLWIRDQGFNLWYDDGIDVGSGWRQALADAITGAAGVIFFVTARSVVSDNCMREIGFALDENKSVFVVQLDDALLPSVLRLSLSDRQALVRSDFSEDAYHERLTDALRGKTDLSLAVSPQSEIRKQRTRMTASVVAALALGGAIYLAWSLLVRHPPTITLDNPTQITNAAGVEDYPAISPDGRTIAYHANGDGDWDIWVIQPGSADALNRTADFHGQDMYPTWSPDGRQIAFWSERDGGGYFVMQALAGAPRKVVSLEAEIGADYRYIPMSPPRWSSDGERLMYVRGAVSLGSYAEVIEIGSGKTTRVDMPGRVFGFDPVWSPDEQTISYVAGWHREYETNQIKALRLADGHNTEVTGHGLFHLSPTWASNRSLAYVVNRGSSRDLWIQRIDGDLHPTGQATRLTTGVGMMHAVFSADGSRLAYSQGRRVANVWRVPIRTSRPATWSDAEQLTFDQAWVEFIDVSPDGERLAICTNRSGNKDLWLLDTDGSELRQLTTDPLPEWGPRWSPDGRQISFYAYRGDGRSSWIVPAAGGAAQPLVTKGVGQTFMSTWSPDGTSMAFRGLDPDNNNDIYLVASAGGGATRLTRHSGMDAFPHWSPDSDLISFVSLRSGTSQIWAIASAGGVAEQLTSGGMSYHDWAPDGSTIYASGVGDREGNIWAYDVATGRETAVTNLGGRAGALGTEALTTDGEYLYFTWVEDFADIWLMDVVSQPRRGLY